MYGTEASLRRQLRREIAREAKVHAKIVDSSQRSFQKWKGLKKMDRVRVPKKNDVMSEIWKWLTRRR